MVLAGPEIQAEHLATQRLHNNGYNCVAAQVIVISSTWPQKDAFMVELRRAFAAAPGRASYYPGSDDRTRAAADAHEQVQRFGDRVLLNDLPQDGDPAFDEEYFGPVLGVVELPGTGQEFLDRAVDFANTRLTGTLGANIVAHPRTMRRLGTGFEQALANLRYGTIAINAWTGLGFLTARAPWGAFPGHTLQDAQSGIGVVHNGLLLDQVERTIIRGPFRPFPRSILTGMMTFSPRPPWFVSNRTSATTGRRLTRFAAKPTWLRLAGVVVSALRG